MSAVDSRPGEVLSLCRIPREEVVLYAPVFHRGSLSLDLYAPRLKDYQQAHTHDEFYQVLRGEGWFVNGGHRHRFAAGDCLFVPAGVNHRFEGFGDDFLTWVLFWGPDGGEADPPWPAQALPEPPWHWQPEAALRCLDEGAEPRSALLFEHGSMRLKVFAPRGADRQSPHRQDEVYLVHSGHGRLQGAGTNLAFEPGDALFVAAGAEHRFVDFSPDLVLWVVFYGPEGGESR